jgi:hypothetical protein
MKKILALFASFFLFSALIQAQTVTAGTFVKKIGDFEVYTNGEVFYRTMTKAHYDAIVAGSKLSASSETFTSPTQAYSEKFSGYLVKILVNTGTIDKLKAIGVSDGTADVQSKFGTMPLVASGWGTTKAFFKSELGQVNIGLGTGTALTTFNANFKQYQLIKIIP